MKIKFIFLNLFLSFLNPFFKNKEGVLVLTTHEVKQKNLINFELRIKKILKTHSFISPDFFFNYLKGKKKLKKKSVLITFDDGFLSSFNAALKILDKYNIKAIFFIPTAIFDLKSKNDKINFLVNNIYFNKLDNPKLDKEDYEFMKIKHLKILHDNGHMICPHTHTHVKVNTLKLTSSFHDELVKSKNIINKLFGNKLNAMAIPVGTHREINKPSFNQIVSNYDYNFTTIYGKNIKSTNPHLLYRVNFPQDSTEKYLTKILSGFYDAFYCFRMKNLISKLRN
jgi:peptidoglycan/xylan/chitin deacetylase (PgdA/CDA1 family)